MFKKLKKRHHKTLFAIVVGTAVISFWRGTWGLLDLYLLPHNLTLSYLASVFIGLAILYITHYIVTELL